MLLGTACKRPCLALEECSDIPWFPYNTVFAGAPLYCFILALCRLLAEDDLWADDEGFVAEVVMAAYEKRRAQTEIINAMPLYPTEKLLWDENQVPNVQYTGASPARASICPCTHCVIMLLRNADMRGLKWQVTPEILEHCRPVYVSCLCMHHCTCKSGGKAD